MLNCRVRWTWSIKRIMAPLWHQVLSSLAMRRWSSTPATNACQSSRQGGALMSTTTSLLIRRWAAVCPSCPPALKSPWIPSRRSTSTTHLVTITTTRDKLWVVFDLHCWLKNLSTPLCLTVATSTSVREFTVVSAERGSESFSFQLKQNITYRDCRHDNRAATPETLQITMERVFVMYVKEERILRYAITNKISPVGGESSWD